MIRNLHRLLVLPSASGAVAFAARRAELLPVAGLCLYFPSGPQTRLEKVAYWLKRLHRNPVVWLQPSEDAWVMDLNGAKQQFSDDLVKSYPSSSALSWPCWLNGMVTLTPEFETGEGFQPRLAFFLTELAVAKAKAPSPQTTSVVVNQFIAGGIT